jgi:murein DD-endopeptidase MepM/ murein hydrolase activator NlpD
MQSQSWRITLLGITTFSSLYTGLSMKAAHAQAEANPEASEGPATVTPSASESSSVVVRVTVLPELSAREPGLQPRFADPSPAKVMPKSGRVSPTSGPSLQSSRRELFEERPTTTAELPQDPRSDNQSTDRPPTLTELLTTSEPERANATNSPQSALSLLPEQSEPNSQVTSSPNLEDSPPILGDAMPGSSSLLTPPLPMLNRSSQGSAPAPLEPAPLEFSNQSDERDPLQPTEKTAQPTMTGNDAAAASHYRIQAGDTLLKIAEELNVSVEELAQANNIQDINLIMAGAELVLPEIPENPAIEPTATRASATVAAADFTQTEATAGGGSEAVSSTISTPSSETATFNTGNTSLLNHLQATVTRPVDSTTVLTRLQNIETTTEHDTTTPEPDIYTANLIAAVNATQDNPVEIAVIPADMPASPGLPAPPSVTTLPTLSPTASPRTPQALTAAAPLSNRNIIAPGQPTVGDRVEPEMPLLPGSHEYFPQTSSVNGYVWPTRGRISSGYGWRWGRMHRGVDIAAPTGTPVMAAAPGVVEFAGWNNGGYGNLVDIRHADGSLTRYAHNSRVVVRSGQSVLQGQLISEVGSTGYSTGPHLHFEIHQPNQGTVNPLAFLPER